MHFKKIGGKIIEGSISEKTWVDINGVKQGMFIKGINKSNPVLLFLHGGPGMPEIAIARQYPVVLEKFFTVCWWEQRGTGISFHKDVKPKHITFENLMNDTVEVTHYLRRRFKQEKIFLFGHSGGSFLGIQVCKLNPQLFHAYIGMAQMVNQLESEKIAYKYMVDEYKKMGNNKMVKKFEKFDLLRRNSLPKGYGSFRDMPMHELGIGTTHKMRSVITGVFIPVMLYSEYTFVERVNVWRGKYNTQIKAGLFKQAVETDLSLTIKKLEIPVYFLEGIFDYTCNYAISKQFFKDLDAPIKGFYTFYESAHSPIFEEPQRASKIITEDILRLQVGNSDSEV